MTERRVSLLTYCVERQGVHRGSVTAAHVIEMAWATNDLGHFPTTVEYADWNHVDERTAWRHRAAIRDAFGDDWQRVVERLAVALKRESGSARRLSARLGVPSLA